MAGGRIGLYKARVVVFETLLSASGPTKGWIVESMVSIWSFGPLFVGPFQTV